jgi:hypothetical protein
LLNAGQRVGHFRFFGQFQLFNDLLDRAVWLPLVLEEESWRLTGTISGTVSTGSEEALTADSQLRQGDAVNVPLRSTASEHVRGPGVCRVDPTIEFSGDAQAAHILA